VTNLLVLAPNWLGDAVMALPAIADLRRHFRDARLAIAARASVAPLFEMVEGVDEVVSLPGGGGWRAVVGADRDAKAIAGRFDAAVLLPNSFASALTTKRAGIAERWGFATDFRSRLLTRAVPKPNGAQHQAAYYQALVAGLGIPTGPAYARITPRTPHVAPGTPHRAPRTPHPEPFVVLAPGAAYGSAKQWMPERFAELARSIVRDRGWHVFLVGSGADRSVCDEIARTARESVTNLCGQTDLAGLAALLASARAVVSNDSGAMHLAGAVGAKVVGIFGATNEHRTSPLTSGPGAPAPSILTADAWCRPCMLRECPIDHRCMRGISAASVLAAL
jgi:heptosyltransferase-2